MPERGMSEDTLQRTRIVYAVGEAVKYISHLDLLRAWERILRRAEVPLAYSHGYNPHPRLVIAMPLPVGCTGAHEVIDAYLYEPMRATTLLEALDGQMPEGLAAVAVGKVDRRGPAMPSVIDHAVYQIALDGVGVAEVRRRAAELMAREWLPVTFRRKTFDLRPLLGHLQTDAAHGEVVLEAALLRLPSGRIGRPDVLLEALDLAQHMRRIHRVRIAFDVPVL
jgi:radical SAM-linked protein